MALERIDGGGVETPDLEEGAGVGGGGVAHIAALGIADDGDAFGDCSQCLFEGAQARDAELLVEGEVGLEAGGVGGGGLDEGAVAGRDFIGCASPAARRRTS